MDATNYKCRLTVIATLPEISFGDRYKPTNDGFVHTGKHTLKYTPKHQCVTVFNCITQAQYEARETTGGAGQIYTESQKKFIMTE